MITLVEGEKHTLTSVHSVRVRRRFHAHLRETQVNFVGLQAETKALALRSRSAQNGVDDRQSA